MSKKLMIDFDCTLVDFLTPYLGWCKSHLDIDTSKFDMTEYDWPRKFIGDGCSAFWNANVYFNEVKPFEGAREFLEELDNEDIQFCICTIVEEKSYLQKREMILDLFPIVGHYHRLIMLPATTSKRHTLECDDSYLFIDDRKSYIDHKLDILYNHNSMHPWADNRINESFNVMTSYDEIIEHVLG
jgi:hypothetical protein